MVPTPLQTPTDGKHPRGNTLVTKALINNYHFIELLGCQHTACLTATSGTITSVNYPNNYDDNAADSWLITAGNGQTITVAFTDFRLQYSSSCDIDYIILYDGATTSSQRIDDPYCGTTPPLCSTSSGKTMLITFTSDSSDNEKGFSLNYNFAG